MIRVSCCYVILTLCFASPLILHSVNGLTINANLTASSTPRNITTSLRYHDQSEWPTTACTHNGSVFANGSMVPTMEPCLSCQCMNKTLRCSRRICSEMPVPPPRGCALVQRRDSCCPFIVCSKSSSVSAFQNRIGITDSNRWSNRNSLELPDTEDGDTGDDSYKSEDNDDAVCIYNGTVYKSGSAMTSSSLCTYCYCIHGRQRCVRPRCLLPSNAIGNDNCKPVFIDIACCPIKYQCNEKRSVDTPRMATNSNRHYVRRVAMLKEKRGCLTENGRQFGNGERMPEPEPCKVCYCIRGERLCTMQKCHINLKETAMMANHQCQPMMQTGQCCPVSYHCEKRSLHKSRQFDLISMIFDLDKVNTSTVSPPQPSSTILIRRESTTLTPPSSTSEKSFFDVIRDGLDFINSQEPDETTNVDTDYLNINESTHIENKEQEDIPADEDDDENLSFLDLLLGNKKPAKTKPADQLKDQSIVNKTNTQNAVPILSTTSSPYSTTDLQLTTSDLAASSEEETEYENVSKEEYDEDASLEEKQTQSTPENQSEISSTILGTASAESATGESAENRDQLQELQIGQRENEMKESEREDELMQTTTVENLTTVSDYNDITQPPPVKEGNATVEDDASDAISELSSITETSTTSRITTSSNKNSTTEQVLATSEIPSSTAVPHRDHTTYVSLIERHEMSTKRNKLPAFSANQTHNRVAIAADKNQTKNKQTVELALKEEQIPAKEAVTAIKKGEITENAEDKINVEKGQRPNNKYKEPPQGKRPENVNNSKVQPEKISHNTTTESILNAFISGLSDIFIESPEDDKTTKHVISSTAKPEKIVTKQLNTTKMTTKKPFTITEATDQPDIVVIKSKVEEVQKHHEKIVADRIDISVEEKTEVDCENVDTTTRMDVVTEATPKQSTKSSLTSKSPIKSPVVINPTILDYYDYYEPTLPPSLPNLKIIPFLPADAVKKHHGVDHSEINLKKYTQLSAENIGPPTLPFFTEYTNDGKFSPPLRTEGGFMPADKNSEFFHRNGNIVVDLTTSKPVPTLINSFNDVIRTEPPPNLQSLIVDKKHLQLHQQQHANHQSASEEQNNVADFISITTALNEHESAQSSLPHTSTPIAITTDRPEPHSIMHPDSNSSNGSDSSLHNQTDRNDFFNSFMGFLFRDNDGPVTPIDIKLNAAQVSSPPPPPPFKSIDSSLPLFDIWPPQMYHEQDIIHSTTDTIKRTDFDGQEDSAILNATPQSVTDEQHNIEPFFPYQVQQQTAIAQDRLDTNVDDALEEKGVVDTSIINKILERPSTVSRHPDPILKLAGCNIYGRMYRVGRIISELSGPCLECKCTDVGVHCTPLNC